MAVDGFGRDINYLRISLTDRCNLRCVYCMPASSQAESPASDLLTPQEIETIVRAAVGLGFHKFRLTGGEPTLRRDLIEIVQRLAAIPGVRDLAMTTNGTRLPQLAGPLRQAGLQRLNIHVDSLHPGRLARIMRLGSLEQIWNGIEAAVAAGFHPLKLNCAVARDYNHQDVVPLARLTLEHDWHVRFIELMPLTSGPCAELARTRFVSSAETRARIEAELGALTPVPPVSPSEESRNFRLPNARGIVGFISPVSEPFCGNCSRLRLTADGRLHLCLLNDDEEEVDVRAALRNGNGRADVEAVLRAAIAAKPVGHRLEEGVSLETRAMFQMGG